MTLKRARALATFRTKLEPEACLCTGMLILVVEICSATKSGAAVPEQPPRGARSSRAVAVSSPFSSACHRRRSLG